MSPLNGIGNMPSDENYKEKTDRVEYYIVAVYFNTTIRYIKTYVYLPGA